MANPATRHSDVHGKPKSEGRRGPSNARDSLGRPGRGATTFVFVAHLSARTVLTFALAFVLTGMRRRTIVRLLWVSRPGFIRLIGLIRIFANVLRLSSTHDVPHSKITIDPGIAS